MKLRSFIRWRRLRIVILFFAVFAFAAAIAAPPAVSEGEGEEAEEAEEAEEEKDPKAGWDDMAKEIIPKMYEVMYDAGCEGLKTLECAVAGTWQDTKLQKEKTGFIGVMELKEKEVSKLELKAADDIGALFDDRWLKDLANEWYGSNDESNYHNLKIKGEELKKRKGWKITTQEYNVAIELDEKYVPRKRMSGTTKTWEGWWKKLPNDKYVITKEYERHPPRSGRPKETTRDDTRLEWKKVGGFYLPVRITQKAQIKFSARNVGTDRYDIAIDFSDFTINGKKAEIEEDEKKPDDGDGAGDGESGDGESGDGESGDGGEEAGDGKGGN